MTGPARHGAEPCRLPDEVAIHNLPNPALVPDWSREDLEAWARKIGDHCPIDLGIARVVRALMESGVETYESCEGGPGHVSRWPFVHFYGDASAGLRAVAVCLTFGFPVMRLAREWTVARDELLNGPFWRIELRPTDIEYRHAGACWSDDPTTPEPAR